MHDNILFVLLNLLIIFTSHFFSGKTSEYRNVIPIDDNNNFLCLRKSGLQLILKIETGPGISIGWIK